MLVDGKCSSPDDCSTKSKPSDLCKSCKCWYRELAASHERGKNPTWYKNCNSARWSEDKWEVAKFFIPPLGSQLNTVKDAKSTDLLSLLHVIGSLKNAAFSGAAKVNLDLVRKFRFEVQKTWAHASQQELRDKEIAHSLAIAKDFLLDLHKVSPNAENKTCLEKLRLLNTEGFTNVVECEIQSLLLQYRLLDDIREEMTAMPETYGKSVIEENEQSLWKFELLEYALEECSQRVSDFQTTAEEVEEQFVNFAKEWKSFRAIPDNIREMRNSITLAKISLQPKAEASSTTSSCSPDELSDFTGREEEVQKILTFILDAGKAFVSLYGGPGFGKTAIAIKVSHKLKDEHKVPVVFCQLASVTTEDEAFRRICYDVGICNDSNPKSSLTVWLKNIRCRVVIILDNIDDLLKKESNSFYEFVRLLTKNSNQLCQIVTTSRMPCEIPELFLEKIPIKEMDNDASMELLSKQCPGQDDDFLQRLGELCGNIPLAMCIAGSRVDDFKDCDELLEHLQNQSKNLGNIESDHSCLYRAINMSYEKCTQEEKDTFLRLSVFVGSFSDEAAEIVIEKEASVSKRVLKILVQKSLINQLTEHRFAIHLVIKRFLKYYKDGENESVKSAMQAKSMQAKVLMIKYYLKLADQLTMNSYSKDGYKRNREVLKKEVHNIQNVLEIYGQPGNPIDSKISDCLEDSEIYTKSARFVSLFVRTIIPGVIVDEFLQRCSNLANEKRHHAIKINFDCLLVDQERSKAIGKSNEKFVAKMKDIEKEFETHYEDFKEDKSLCAHFYYQ